MTKEEILKEIERRIKWCEEQAKKEPYFAPEYEAQNEAYEDIKEMLEEGDVRIMTKEELLYEIELHLKWLRKEMKDSKSRIAKLEILYEIDIWEWAKEMLNK